MSDYTKPQPPPQEGTAYRTWFLVGQHLAQMAQCGGKHWDLLIHDAGQRDAMGGEKYGVRHRSDNGRDHATDGYQMLLDACCYWRAEADKYSREPMNCPHPWDIFASTVRMAYAARQYLYERDGK